jgi:peroxiredoxin Q/BCP
MPPKRKSMDASASEETAGPRRSSRNAKPDEAPRRAPAKKAKAPTKKARPAPSKEEEKSDAEEPASVEKVVGEEIPDITLKNENDEDVKVKDALGDKGCA